MQVHEKKIALVFTLNKFLYSTKFITNDSYNLGRDEGVLLPRDEYTGDKWTGRMSEWNSRPRLEGCMCMKKGETQE